MYIHKPNFRHITQGLDGAEGPVFNASGNAFYMVVPCHEVEGKHAGQIVSVDTETGEVKVVQSPSVNGFGGIPAGCQADKSDNLWVADMRLGLLHVNTKTADCKQICQVDAEGNAMQGCNDCVFDKFGNLWITAPAGRIAPAPYTRSMQEAFGSIYCFDALGGMKRIDTGYKFPNGIAVQYDEEQQHLKNLIVAETPTKTLWAFPFDGRESIADVSLKKVFARCPGTHEGGPDGMDFDIEGNLLVANWGSGYIDVFGPSGGDPHSRIELPFKNVSNLHFKPKSNEVYVTEHDTDGLWSFEWIHQGAPQFCEM